MKICGITTPEDACACEKAGANLVGLNFWPRSPRHVSPDRAREIVAVLRRAEAVGLFVDPAPGEVEAAVAASGVRYAQIHGAGGAPVPVIRAVPADRLPVDSGTDHALLVDSARVGGTGVPIDEARLEAVAALARRARVLLAGGLRPETVGAAVRRVRPWGVDVASGVETVPGRKDPAKVEAFIEAARRAAA